MNKYTGHGVSLRSLTSELLQSVVLARIVHGNYSRGKELDYVNPHQRQADAAAPALSLSKQA